MVKLKMIENPEVKRKYNYVYITTNLINGKQYIGDHSSDKENDNYLGSGSLIMKAINFHKKNNFKKEILEYFETKKEAFLAQERYIIKYNTLHPNGYNLSPTGGLLVAKCYHPDKVVSAETRAKISASLKGRKKSPRTKEHSQKILESKRNNGYEVWNKGKKMNEAFCEMRRRVQKGKPSSRKGKKLSEESKLKISQKKKGVKQQKYLCKYCNRYIGVTNYKRFHDEKCKKLVI